MPLPGPTGRDGCRFAANATPPRRDRPAGLVRLAGRASGRRLRWRGPKINPAAIVPASRAGRVRSGRRRGGRRLRVERHGTGPSSVVHRLSSAAADGLPGTGRSRRVPWSAAAGGDGRAARRRASRWTRVLAIGSRTTHHWQRQRTMNRTEQRVRYRTPRRADRPPRRARARTGTPSSDPIALSVSILLSLTISDSDANPASIVAFADVRAASNASSAG